MQRDTETEKQKDSKTICWAGLNKQVDCLWKKKKEWLKDVLKETNMQTEEKELCFHSLLNDPHGNQTMNISQCVQSPEQAEDAG